MNEFIARPSSIAGARSVVDFPKDPSSSFRASAAAALDLVSEVATAVKSAEERSAEMVVRAEDLANAAIEELRLAEARAEHAEARAERAEAAQRQADADVAALSAAAAEARNDLEMSRTRLVARESELATAERRASAAERRAADAEAAVERIVDAIRTQLPLVSGDAEVNPDAA